MKIYISMLRGINVNGKNIIKMDSLKRLFESLEFQNVSTYIQSGNVVFTSELKDETEIEKIITYQIGKEFAFQIPVIVMNENILKQCLEKNPFAKDKEPEFLHFSFLSGKPDLENVELLHSKKEENEEIYISERVVYLYCPNGYGRTKLNNTFLEKKLHVKATTRNWKTTNQLLKMTEAIHHI